MSNFRITDYSDRPPFERIANLDQLTEEELVKEQRRVKAAIGQVARNISIFTDQLTDATIYSRNLLEYYTQLIMKESNQESKQA